MSPDLNAVYFHVMQIFVNLDENISNCKISWLCNTLLWIWIWKRRKFWMQVAESNANFWNWKWNIKCKCIRIWMLNLLNDALWLHFYTVALLRRSLRTIKIISTLGQVWGSLKTLSLILCLSQGHSIPNSELAMLFRSLDFIFLV